MWFTKGDISCLGSWLVYMFETEIKTSFNEFKKGKTDDNEKSFYSYLKQNYDLPKIRQVLQKVITNNFMENESPSSQNYKNKKNFLLTKCMDRIEEEYDRYEYLISYSWYYENKQNENFKIMAKCAQTLKQRYMGWKEEKRIEMIEQKEEMDRLNKIAKRKKKREKNKQQKVQEKEEKEKKRDAQQRQKSKDEINKEVKVEICQSKEQNQQLKESHKTEKTMIQTQNKMKSHRNNKSKKSQQKEKYRIEEDIQEQTIIPNKLALKANKKIIKDRINECYDFITSELIKNAEVYDRYKKVAFDVISDFINTIMAQQKIGLDKKWALEIYGSCSAGFSLRHSDIDLVLLADITKISLSQIQEQLKLKEWSLNCKLIQAQVPIITLKVNLLLAPLAHKILNNKQLKKLANQPFSVDLTLASINQPHSGIENTKQLRQIYDNVPAIRKVCILLKQFLRVRRLNKPYKGGINSYVLIIMIYFIIQRKRNVIDIKKNVQIPDQYQMVGEISKFMQNEFKPFETVISWEKNEKTVADKGLHLNVINPKNGQLLKTSAFEIQKIIMELKKFRQWQEFLEEEMLQMDINNKKSMKTFFFNHFESFFYEGQN